MPGSADMMKRQKILADFGEFAIHSENLDDVLMEACRLVGQALGTGRAKVLEIQQDRQELFVRAGVGWREDVVGTVRLQMNERSSETYSIRAGEPVITRDIATETRFDVPAFMKEAGVVALVNVPIFVPGDRPYGILQVDDTKPRDFGENEIQFLRTYATILGPVIDRLHLVEERRAMRERMFADLASVNGGLPVSFRATHRHKEAEMELLRIISLLRTTFDSSLQIIQLFKAIRDHRDRIVDFEWVLTNRQWNDRWGPMTGKRLLKENPAVVETGVWDKFLQVIETGDPVLHEHFYAHEQFHGWFLQTIAKADDGILLSTLDITDQKRTELALSRREAHYRMLFNSIDEGFCIIEVLFDEDDTPVDYRFIEANAAFERQTGLKDAVGKRMRELEPEHEQHWFDIYGQVALTGSSQRFEARADALGHWYSVYAFRVDEPERRRVAILFDDIGDRKRSEEALRESEERYRTLFETMNQGYDECELIRGADGRAVDYRILDMNPAFERLIGVSASEARGRPASEVIPGLESWWVETFDEMIRSGRPKRIEREVVQLGRWYEVNAYPRGGDRFVALFEDITERKQAEAALRESEARLSVVLESVPAGIAAIDTEGRTIVANASYRRFLPTGVIPSRDPRRGERWRGWREDGALLDPRNYPGARALRGESVIPGQEMLYTDDEGRDIWTNVATAPLHDTNGQVTGAVAVISDITARRHAMDALRESEERLRKFGEASQDVLWIRDAETLQWSYLTPAFETIYGIDRSEALARDNYRNWMDLILPADRSHVEAMIARVRAGEQVTFEYRVRRPRDGEIRWLRDTDFPINDSSGKIAMLGGVGQDITGIKEAQQRLEQSEERLQSAVQVGKLGLWDWNIPTGKVHWSDEHFRLEGYAVGEVTPSYEAWAARIHPEDRARTEAALHEAMDTRQEYEYEFRTLHPDGSVHWLYGRGRFFYDVDGSPLRMVGAITDTTDRREWEDRQNVLVAELQHRTRNLMAVVRAMSNNTARSSSNLDEFQASFHDRLDALARVQGLLSQLGEMDRVTFGDLIRSEINAMDGGSGRVELDGPDDVRLRSSSVQTLAMALHELATNAVKYGALARDSGRLTIRWSLQYPEVEGKPWPKIDWRESGVEMRPEGSAPQGGGQGRELIERALPYQLGAKTSYEHGPTGIHCVILLPISQTNRTMRSG